MVFVVIVLVFVEDLLCYLSVDGVVEFCLKFFLVFWSWNVVIFYIERFELIGFDN